MSMVTFAQRSVCNFFYGFPLVSQCRKVKVSINVLKDAGELSSSTVTLQIMGAAGAPPPPPSPPSARLLTLSFLITSSAHQGLE